MMFGFLFFGNVSAQIDAKLFLETPASFKISHEGIKEISNFLYYYNTDSYGIEHIVDSIKDIQNFNIMQYIIEDDYQSGGDTYYSKEIYKYQYNDKGNLIEISIIENDTIRYTYCYFFDPGNNLKEIVHCKNGRIINFDSLKYDGNGVLMEHLGYDSTGLLIARATYTYYESGRKFEKYADSYELYKNFSSDTLYNQNGGYIYREFCTYDKKGNLVELVTPGVFGGPSKHLLSYGAGGVETSGIYRWSYDEQGKILEKKRLDNLSGSIIEVDKITYEYDSKGNLIREKNAYSRDISVWSYKFDDKGNWIEKTEYLEGKKFHVVKRKIVYF
jgi:YD repeat-containing protein